MSLAYVFWHWPRSGVDRKTYEEGQRGFHRALHDSPPAGFGRSRSFRVSDASWLPAGAGYEDWYEVEDFCALGTLNEGAVSAARQIPHDAAAALAGGGAGGVYRRRSGAALESPAFALWLSKPDGMSYPALWSLLDPFAGEHAASIWMRQMVLGPAPELCIHSSVPITLPAPLSGHAMRLRPIFP